MLLLPLDDLLAVTREFICQQAKRSGLDRCLRRYRVGNVIALKPKEPSQPHKVFKTYEPGCIHIDVKYLPQMPDETSRLYLFRFGVTPLARTEYCSVNGFKDETETRGVRARISLANG